MANNKITYIDTISDGQTQINMETFEEWEPGDPCPECGSEELFGHKLVHEIATTDNEFSAASMIDGEYVGFTCFGCDATLQLHPALRVFYDLPTDHWQSLGDESMNDESIEIEYEKVTYEAVHTHDHKWEDGERCPKCHNSAVHEVHLDEKIGFFTEGTFSPHADGDRLATLKRECTSCGKVKSEHALHKLIHDITV